MPIMNCVLNGKRGKKFGAAGKCFVGDRAEELARNQGMAVLMSEAKAAGHADKKSMDEYVAKRAARELGNA